MRRDLNGDEHQFIASGALLKSKLLIPYKDYPYFHMPNLVFIYGIIFSFSDHLLFSARLFSVICASFALGLIFYISFDRFKYLSYSIRFFTAAGFVVLLVTNPYFIFTNGRAWNHDLPILCNLLAFIFHCRSADSNKTRWILLSGLFLGFAIGTRITFIFNVVPFVLITLAFPNAVLKRKLYLIFLFCLGVFAASLPSLTTFIASPERFIFGNLGYKHFSMMYHKGMYYSEGLPFIAKFLKLIKNIFLEPRNSLLFSCFIFFISLSVWHRMKGILPRTLEIPFLLMIIFCHFIGAFSPPRANYQYFYAPIPFIVIAVIYALANIDKRNKGRWNLSLVGLVIIISGLYGFSHYPNFSNLLSPHGWFPIRIHQRGIQIANLVGKGPVLTIAPLFPMEGGVEIYEQFATGAFAWRISKFLSDEQREKFGITSQEELKDSLKSRPPKGILVGYERALEEPFVDYAKENNYKKSKVKRKTLWIRSE
jgi:hypothetical protein